MLEIGRSSFDIRYSYMYAPCVGLAIADELFLRESAVSWIRYNAVRQSRQATLLVPHVWFLLYDSLRPFPRIMALLASVTPNRTSNKGSHDPCTTLKYVIVFHPCRITNGRRFINLAGFRSSYQNTYVVFSVLLLTTCFKPVEEQRQLCFSHDWQHTMHRVRLTYTVT